MILLALVALLSWPIAKIEPAIARLTVVDGTCTAFRIHPERWVTASHCLTSGIVGAKIDDVPVIEVLEDNGKDGAAVVRTFRSDGPKLSLAFAKRGDEVLGVGYGGGSPRIIFFPMVVVMEDVELDRSHVQTYSAGAVEGMSGGPIVNRKGQVTGVLLGHFVPSESSTAMIGFSPTYAALKAIVDRWK